MTTFGDQVYQHGGVPLGGSMLPVMAKGAKAFFVDPVNGTSAGAGTLEDPLTTVSGAYALCTDKAGDVIYVLNDGNSSGSVRETAALVWAKDNTHLVGLCAPALNQRSRITPTSGTTDVDAFTPFLTVSGHGNIFQNISLVQGNSEDGKASIGITCSGNRNYFNRVSVLTGQHANQGDEASMSISMTGEENLFEDCVIGTDTVARGGAVSANVDFSGQAARNVWRNCIFPMFADDTDPVFILSSSVSDTDRFNLFDGCNFLNTGSSSLVAGVSYAANSGGYLFLKDCAFFGMDDVTAADHSYVVMNGPTMSAPVDVGHYKGVDIA